MTIRTRFPHKVREIENFWIPMSDGARLSARVWMPEGAEASPVPALLEYLPYRKDDGTVKRDALRQPYLAGHGYAAVRVDMRGSGNSDGILHDEYLRQEQDDALEVIAWLAEQPWCDGKVGMHGISWGGFNSLQVAARQPEALKAILVIGFTDDRYNDDVHYMGGCLLASQMLQWASVMFAYNASPPDPRFVGERWRAMWLERMEKTPPYIEAWLRHQRRDDYWRHGSVGEDYSAISVPVMAVGGWVDSYNNSIPRLLAGLKSPRLGIIGPWAHAFPELGPPGPVIGFLQESLRWWDHWLKGIDTGIMDEPILRTWIQQYEPPARHYTVRKGFWVSEAGWPSENVQPETFYLNHNGPGGRLDPVPSREREVPYRGLLAHGFDHIGWGSYGQPGEYPGDQRSADGEALSFDSQVLDATLVLLGNPSLSLDLSSDQALALVAARLCDVAPDGSSKLISWGLLNLAQRESQEVPSPLEPGLRYQVTFNMNILGYEVKQGHRLRLSLSPTYSRQAWPSPEPATLTFFTGPNCSLNLPVRRPQSEDGPDPFQPAESAPPLTLTWLREPARKQRLVRNQTDDRLEFTLEEDGGRMLLPTGMEVDDWSLETHALQEGDPLSVRQRVQANLEYKRDEWSVRIETDSRLHADQNHFFVRSQMKGYIGDEQVFSKTWEKKIPRDLM